MYVLNYDLARADHAARMERAARYRVGRETPRTESLLLRLIRRGRAVKRRTRTEFVVPVVTAR